MKCYLGQGAFVPRFVLSLCLSMPILLSCTDCNRIPGQAVPVAVLGMELWRCNSAILLGDSSYVSVRAGPSEDFRKTDKLERGHEVFTCDDREGWVGIIYGPAGRCDLRHTTLRGPNLPRECQSGWIPATSVETTSG